MPNTKAVHTLGKTLGANDLLGEKRHANVRRAHEHGAHRHVLGSTAWLVVGYPVVAGENLHRNAVDAVGVEEAILDTNGDGQNLEHRTRLVGRGHGLEREGV